MSTIPPARNGYPTDVSDDEWALVAPYLSLLSEDALQRRYPLREVFNALRWIVRAGAPWRLLPTNFPPWQAVYQQTRRWLEAGCFEAWRRYDSARQGLMREQLLAMTKSKGLSPNLFEVATKMLG